MFHTWHWNINYIWQNLPFIDDSKLLFWNMFHINSVLRFKVNFLYFNVLSWNSNFIKKNSFDLAFLLHRVSFLFFCAWWSYLCTMHTVKRVRIHALNTALKDFIIHYFISDLKRFIKIYNFMAVCFKSLN